MENNIGRSETRLYTAAAFPDGYYEATPHEIRGIEDALRGALIAAGFQERVYDEEAVAFHKGDSELRKETLMLRHWKANMGRSIDLNSTSQAFDTVGLTVIIRGFGAVQRSLQQAVVAMTGVDMDSTSTDDCRTYTFAYREEGEVEWNAKTR